MIQTDITRAEGYFDPRKYTSDREVIEIRWKKKDTFLNFWYVIFSVRISSRILKKKSIYYKMFYDMISFMVIFIHI